MINFIYFSFSLTSYSPRLLGKKNKFISFRERSLDNHTQFQTKMFKIYTRFQTKTAQKPYPLGGNIPIYLIIGEYPPPPGSMKKHLVARSVVRGFFLVRRRRACRADNPTDTKITF